MRSRHSQLKQSFGITGAPTTRDPMMPNSEVRLRLLVLGPYRSFY